MALSHSRGAGSRSTNMFSHLLATEDNSGDENLNASVSEISEIMDQSISDVLEQDNTSNIPLIFPDDLINTNNVNNINNTKTECVKSTPQFQYQDQDSPIRIEVTPAHVPLYPITPKVGSPSSHHDPAPYYGPFSDTSPFNHESANGTYFQRRNPSTHHLFPHTQTHPSRPSSPHFSHSPQPPPWRKLLWLRQPYPDNHVDSSFLSQLKQNSHVQPYSFWTLSTDFSPVLAHLCSVALFGIVFCGIYSRGWNPTAFAAGSVILSVTGYIFLWSWEGGYCIIFNSLRDLLNTPEVYEKSRNGNMNGFSNNNNNNNNSKNTTPVSDFSFSLATVKSAILILFTILALSPVLKSLTQSTSSDSIWVLACWLTLANVLCQDYKGAQAPSVYRSNKSSKEKQVGGSNNKNSNKNASVDTNISDINNNAKSNTKNNENNTSPDFVTEEFRSSSMATNLAMAAAIVLASRLDTTIAVFSFILFSIELFGVFPAFIKRIRYPIPNESSAGGTGTTTVTDTRTTANTTTLTLEPVLGTSTSSTLPFSSNHYGLAPSFSVAISRYSKTYWLLLTFLVIATDVGLWYISGPTTFNNNGNSTNGNISTSSSTSSNNIINSISSSSLDINSNGNHNTQNEVNSHSASTSDIAYRLPVLLAWFVIQIMVLFILPFWFLSLQKYKNEIQGPWDPAKPKLLKRDL